MGRSNRRSGTNAIEFALLIPWYIFLFVGAIDYGFYSYGLIATQSAARVGAMYCAASASAHGRLRAIHISELPSGWLGKTHAMWTAAQQATGDWLLFTDADTRWAPGALGALAAEAEIDVAQVLQRAVHADLDRPRRGIEQPRNVAVGTRPRHSPIGEGPA